MSIFKSLDGKTLSSKLAKKGALLAFLTLAPLSNVAQSMEVITVTGQRLDCIGCMSYGDFMDSYGGYEEEDEQDDDMVEEWQDQRDARWIAKCEADVKAKVKSCKEGVTTGGYWLGGAFCVSTTVVATYFTTPLGGSFYATACGGAMNALVSDATKACEAGGANLKAERCVR